MVCRCVQTLECSMAAEGEESPHDQAQDRSHLIAHFQVSSSRTMLYLCQSLSFFHDRRSLALMITTGLCSCSLPITGSWSQLSTTPSTRKRGCHLCLSHLLPNPVYATDPRPPRQVVDQLLLHPLLILPLSLERVAGLSLPSNIRHGGSGL